MFEKAKGNFTGIFEKEIKQKIEDLFPKNFTNVSTPCLKEVFDY